MKHRHVELVHRSFDPDFYSGLRIKTTSQQAMTAFELATELSNKEVPFGMTTVKGLQAKTTYCSKLVADLLAAAGICIVTLPAGLICQNRGRAKK